MGSDFVKDPNAGLDYKFAWAPHTNGEPNAPDDWLAVGETIASKTITASSGITLDSSSITDAGTSVTVWLSGGTEGSNYTVHCKIVTTNVPPRTDERDMKIKVRER